MKRALQRERVSLLYAFVSGSLSLLFILCMSIVEKKNKKGMESGLFIMVTAERKKAAE